MNNITIIQNQVTRTITYDETQARVLSAILSENGIMLNLTCGGNGYCGKCTVNVNGIPQKACQYIPVGDITVIIGSVNRFSGSVIPHDDVTSYESASANNSINSKGAHVSVAIDIGSTSVSMALVSVETPESVICDSSTIFNPTFEYGADILSRAQASINGSRDAMASVLRNSLNNEITRLLSRHHLSQKNVNSVYIACNLIMAHILLALDCTDLVSFPFSPAGFECRTIYNKIPVNIIPAFSSYVGGDIVSGIYYLDPPKTSGFIFLDLGTNAEIVVSNNGKMFCTSAAAGPAFEGSGISCGQAYVNGAINSVNISTSNTVSYTTIGNKIPTGICGSGVLDAYSELINKHIIDENKTFNSRYIDTGFTIARSLNGPITITQNDIRQIQLAVSAIATGIHILLKHAELELSQIDKVYISGSFGKSLKLTTISSIGILPPELVNESIVEFTGNTSLLGAIRSAILNTAPEEYASLISRCTEIELANDPDFNELFIKNL